MAIAFISHSSAKADKEQRNADLVRHELKTRLREFGWDVRVDEDRLEPGVEWRSVLYHWIGECDAAVVLVNRDGLDSPWLKREVHNLMWRMALGSRVTIVPVLLHGLSTTELRHSEISHLANLQCLVQDDLDRDNEDLVTLVVKRLGDLSIDPLEREDASAMHSLTAKIEYCLDEVVEGPLRRVAQVLDRGKDCGFVTAWEGRREIAHRFLGPVPTELVPPAVKAIAFYLDTDRLKKLISVVLPTWIDPMAVRRLLPGGGRVVATLDSRRTSTARQHIRRASCFCADYCVETVALVAGEAQEQEFTRDCLDAVRSLLNSDDLDELPAHGDVPFLVIDPGGADPNVVGTLLRTLTGRFSWLNVIVLTHSTPLNLGAQVDHSLHIVLGPDDETQLERTIKALRRLLKDTQSYGEELEP
jgi:hypothetical protein